MDSTSEEDDGEEEDQDKSISIREDEASNGDLLARGDDGDVSLGYMQTHKNPIIPGLSLTNEIRVS
jgi:hypothetical protein